MRLDFSDGFVRVGRYKLYHKSIGEAEKGTILCLHGGPGSNHWVAINMADLATYGYKVVWYDQLGCGKSEEPTSNSEYTIKNAADEADGIREALGLGTCHLWGYSYGGALALQTILSHPEGFRSLVVSSGFASLREHYREMRRLVGRMPPKIRRAIREYEAKNEMNDPEYQKAGSHLHAETHIGPEGTALWDIRRRDMDESEDRRLHVWRARRFHHHSQWKHGFVGRHKGPRKNPRPHSGHRWRKRPRHSSLREDHPEGNRWFETRDLP